MYYFNKIKKANSKNLTFNACIVGSFSNGNISGLSWL